MGDQDREIQPVDKNGSEWPVTAVLHVIALAHNAIVYGRTRAAVGINFRWTRTALLSLTSAHYPAHLFPLYLVKHVSRYQAA